MNNNPKNIPDTVQYIEGVTDLYQTTAEKGFKTPEQHPLAWEVIYHNNEAGKSFTLHLLQAFDDFPKERGYISELQGEASDIARCVTCVFKDNDAFRYILNKTMEGKVIYDESKKQIVPRQELINQAKEVTKVKELAMA